MVYRYYTGLYARMQGQKRKSCEKSAFSDAGVQHLDVFVVEGGEGAGVQLVADALHQVVVEPEVVHDGQPHPEQLFRLEQVADVGPAVLAAGGAAAGGVDGALVPLILGVFDVDDAAPGVQVAVAGVAAGHDAVEQVDAAGHRLEDVAGGAHPHQVAYLVLGHMGLDLLDDVVHHLGRLADGQAADGVAVQLHGGDLLHVLHPQVGEGAALVDAEQQLVGVGGPALGLAAGQLGLAAGQPADGPLAAGLGVAVLGGVFDALVKGHGDGGAEVCLDADALLGAHEDAPPVQVGGEGDPLLGDLAQLGQAEHLEAAAVGQDGAVPAGELVQPAQVGHQLVPRAQVEVVGVAEHDLGADLFEVLGGQAALDGAGGGHVLEGGGLHDAVDGGERAPPGRVFLFQKPECGERSHVVVSFPMRGEQPRLARRPCACRLFYYTPRGAVWQAAPPQMGLEKRPGFPYNKGEANQAAPRRQEDRP